MSSITVRKGNGGSISTVPSVWRWDPFRRMRDLMSWDPFQEMGIQAMPEPAAPTYCPAFEVKETKESYVFKADMPGLKEKDIEISLTGDRLTVSGKREAEYEDKGETFYTYERSYGSFTRSFTLPQGVNAEQARADMKDGVLTLVLPKKAEAQAKKIAVKSGEQAKA